VIVTPGNAPATLAKQGVVFRPGTGTTASYVGAEMDLLATYDVTRHLQLYAGYSHFWAGEFIRKTGPSRDSDFLYGAIQYTF
jgi:alginate export protein